MNTIRHSFKNKEGESLSARMELPLERKPHNYVLFAHCFTCNKNLRAITNISRALTAAGFGVLRFDFTGLGESEGDFSDTNFSGNVADLLAAADFLKEHYASPTLLVGHSLGGAAVIFAAAQISTALAVATIAAPSDTKHVLHLLKNNEAEIIATGKAVVNLAARDFTIKKQFLDDLKNQKLIELLRQMRLALLILHAPHDKTVGIDNAEHLFVAAHHPKSFISLDGADHLLSRPEDALYAGAMIAAWATRFVPIPETPQIAGISSVAASLDSSEQFTTQLQLGRHHLVADEPLDVGGKDAGPSPYDLLSGGLAACTAMTLQMYAKRKKWPLENVTVHVAHNRDYASDCAACETPGARIDTFSRTIAISGDLDAGQKERLMQIADKCPVHKTLISQIQIVTEQEL